MHDTSLQAVAELARMMGDIAASLYAPGIVVENKDDGSPVTRADRDAERAAREWIERRFPGEGILGEEFGARAPNAARRWINEPIDGTRSVVRGVPLWGTLVARCEGDRVLAGAAYFPAVRELVAAAPGEGCWWNDARCRVSRVASVAHATLVTTDAACVSRPSRLDAWLALARRARMARTWGDGYGYLLVATGRAEAMVDPIANPWDIAAFVPIIEEAGGVLTDWCGKPGAFGGDAIATNALLAGAVRTILGVERAR